MFLVLFRLDVHDFEECKVHHGNLVLWSLICLKNLNPSQINKMFLCIGLDQVHCKIFRAARFASLAIC